MSLPQSQSSVSSVIATTTTGVSREPSSKALAQTIAEAADERKASEINLLAVADVSYLAEYFVIATGFSKTQVQAISDAIEEKVKQRYQREPLRIDGRSERTWIVLDFGDVMAHIFLPEERQYYGLESFWGHAQRLEYQPAQPPGVE